VVGYLLEQEGIDVMSAGNDGVTALHWASISGRTCVVRRLLEVPSVDAGAVDGTWGWTPLHWAAWNGQEGVMRLLLAHRRNYARTANRAGCTPLHNAAWNRQSGGAVRLLLEHCAADVNTPDKIGRTPLHHAADGGNEDAVKRLLEAGADANALNHNGGTPLDEARNSNGNKAAPLLERFLAAPERTRLEVRFELGQLRHAELFVTVIFVCDGLLRLREHVRRSDAARRFLVMTARLPVEIQMRICNLAVRSPANFVLQRDSEPAFCALAKLCRDMDNGV
jgi:hypothetical protein